MSQSRCGICNDLFERVRRDAHYCSAACRMVAYRIRKKSARNNFKLPRLRLWQDDYAKKLAEATPAWINWSEVEDFYRIAAELTRVTGIKHRVDHIVPIKGPGVCGLHWEGNLEVVTVTENRHQRNKRRLDWLYGVPERPASQDAIAM